MGDTFQNYIFIKGDRDDLIKITRELDFFKRYNAEYDWEHDGVSATIHFKSENGLVFDDIDPVIIKYPSLKLIWKYTHELMYAGIFVYECGKLIQNSTYDWNAGEIVK